ncbi:MAG: hypothetical protein WAN63_17630, partial [Candidatus Sulfotelmatobacter sp.]
FNGSPAIRRSVFPTCSRMNSTLASEGDSSLHFTSKMQFGASGWSMPSVPGALHRAPANPYSETQIAAGLSTSGLKITP